MAPEIKKQFITRFAKNDFCPANLRPFFLQKDMTIQTNYPCPVFLGNFHLLKIDGRIATRSSWRFPFPHGFAGPFGWPWWHWSWWSRCHAHGGWKITTDDWGSERHEISLWRSRYLEQNHGKPPWGKVELLNCWGWVLKMMLLMLFGYGRVEALCPVEFLLLLDLCWLLEVQEVWKYVIWWAS